MGMTLIGIKSYIKDITRADNGFQLFRFQMQATIMNRMDRIYHPPSNWNFHSGQNKTKKKGKKERDEGLLSEEDKQSSLVPHNRNNANDDRVMQRET